MSKTSKWVIIIFSISLVVLVSLVVYTLIKQREKKQLSLTETDTGGSRWVQEFLRTNTYDPLTNTGVRENPANDDSVLIVGSFESFEYNILTVSTKQQVYRLQIDPNLKVLVINESLSREEMRKNLKTIEVGDLKTGDTIIVTCVEDNNNNLIVQSLSKNIFE